MNYKDFISKDKSLLIAPAGYGKTYSLAESLLHTPPNEKQLILTHTHAGIASIKEKIKGFKISGEKYHIETITNSGESGHPFRMMADSFFENRMDTFLKKISL
jgi:DNA helicase-2/ATP-dependent DNA helicase PcrA